MNDCQQVRKVRCRQCEGVGEDAERLRPVPEEEVEVTSARERGVKVRKEGQKVCTGEEETEGRSSPHLEKCSLVSHISLPLELSSSNWIRLELRTQGTERAAERAGSEPGPHRPDMPT